MHCSKVRRRGKDKRGKKMKQSGYSRGKEEGASDATHLATAQDFFLSSSEFLLQNFFISFVLLPFPIQLMVVEANRTKLYHFMCMY